MSDSAKDEARRLAIQFGLPGELTMSGMNCESLAGLIAHVRGATQPVQAQGEAVDMPPYWCVEVVADGERLVSIGHDWVSGSRPLEQADERAILGAAQHLLAFIGHGLPVANFDPKPTPAVDRGLSEAKGLRCEFCQQLGCANPLAASAPSRAEPARPDLRLSYHPLERDDLSLDEVFDVLATGWRKVHGRTERQMLLQLMALMASAPTAQAAPSQAEPFSLDALYEAMRLASLFAGSVASNDTHGAEARSQRLRSHLAKFVVRDPAPSQAGSCQASGPCKTCRGSGVVDDGWMTHSEGGAEFNEPIKCIKDCPDCGIVARNPAPNASVPLVPTGVTRAVHESAPRQPAGRTLTDVVSSMPITWELSWGGGDEESPGNWRVHECSGSRNDREWKLIGEGPTPADAILAASSTTAGERE